MEKNKKTVISIVILFFICGLAIGWYVGWKRGIPFVETRSTKWAIGIYSGNSPFNFVNSDAAKNPVLTFKDVTDIKGELVADPFMVCEKGTWYMFFEVKNKSTNQGDIALATSDDGFHWKYSQVVLDEPFHLSYPYVFKWQGEYYMVPESKRANSVRLYKAVEFPLRWSLVSNLLDGVGYMDSSIFRFDGKWWMFTASGKNDILHLYYAEELAGPWTKHPSSPIIERDANKARPGGRVLVYDGHIIRYAQDDYPFYGNQIRAFEIVELTTNTYKEKELIKSPVTKANGIGWNVRGMHHIDAHRLNENSWIAAVDGCGKELVFGLGY